MRLSGSKNKSEDTEGEKKVLYLLGIESHFTGCPSRSLVAVPAALSRFADKNLKIM
jgi:hypothetical protein